MSQSTLDRLQRDHEQISVLLRVLERQIDSVDRGGQPDYALMGQILHYLTRYPDRYHHVFEDLLFERLAQQRHDLLPVIDRLAAEHESLARLGGRFRSRIEAVLDELPQPRAALARLGRDYVAAYRAHLDCEEAQVFPALACSLTQSDWVTLLTRFEWQSDPLFAGAVAAEYRQLAEALDIMDASDEVLRDRHRRDCPACSERRR